MKSSKYGRDSIRSRRSVSGWSNDLGSGGGPWVGGMHDVMNTKTTGIRYLIVRILVTGLLFPF